MAWNNLGRLLNQEDEVKNGLVVVQEAGQDQLFQLVDLYLNLLILTRDQIIDPDLGEGVRLRWIVLNVSHSVLHFNHGISDLSQRLLKDEAWTASHATNLLP